ncbi:MAG: permease prefix domain 1-containing protein [Bifidobacteriaceae bacterium]|jgi:hypothetical protein|nr:permease prefix domain 1-containing protein [Bifidobacteriaceae bacterium]
MGAESRSQRQPDPDEVLESQISLWRDSQGRHRAVSDDDLAELEDHLRAQIDDLRKGGLAADEAWLIAVKRLGAVDRVSQEFAQAHADRLWRQLALDGGGERPEATGRGLAGVLGLAAGAGATVATVYQVLGDEVLSRNLAFLVLPWLVGYFSWRRQGRWPLAAGVLGAGAAMALAVNLFPFAAGGSTEILTALHLPVVAWVLVGLVYCGPGRPEGRKLMDFARFSGELAIYYALLALGVCVLVLLTFWVLGAAGFYPPAELENGVLLFTLAAALIVAAWLVEAKQSLIENMAPVLTKVFTPLTVAMLVVVLPALAASDNLVGIDRSDLIMFDVVLMLVAALTLFAASARETLAPVGVFDWLQAALVALALAVDAVVLAAMVGRIAEWGSSPNKLAALGLNVLLAAHLAGTGWLSARFLAGWAPFAAQERWHSLYLPLYGGWAATVALVFPIAFDFA